MNRTLNRAARGGMLLLLAGCASHPPNTVPGAADERPPASAGTETVLNSSEPLVVEVVPARPSDGDVICRRESVTGTHQKREICATRAERREQQRDAQEWHRSRGLRGGFSRVPTVR